MSTFPGTPTYQVDEDPAEEQKSARVLARMEWIRDRFLEMGYDGLVADLAGSSFADWHAVKRLLDAGCPRDLALKIGT